MSTKQSVKEIRERVVRSLQSLGVETELENELDLAEQFDSVLFISAVLDLEAEFDIAIPDEYLNLQFFASLDQTANIIEQLIEEQR